MKNPVVIEPNPSPSKLNNYIAKDFTQAEAFETGVVDCAARLLMQINRDETPAVVHAIPKFYAAMSQNLTKSFNSRDPGASVQGAMEDVWQFSGLGDPTPDLGATLYHATSIDGIYQYNISDAYKKSKAQSLGKNPMDQSTWKDPGSPVYWAWLDEVMQAGGVVPNNMLLPTSSVVQANHFSWWTPNDGVNMPGATSYQDGENKYFEGCQLVSLAPDWYPWGTAGISTKTAGHTPVRPTPLDGLNPLWVQRPASQEARTGGDLRETLVEGPLTVAEVTPIAIYPLGQATQKALAAAPSVDVYANNLNLAAPVNGTPEAQTVSFWQVTVVLQCRQARAEANKAFEESAFIASGNGKK